MLTSEDDFEMSRRFFLARRFVDRPAAAASAAAAVRPFRVYVTGADLFSCGHLKRENAKIAQKIKTDSFFKNFSP